MLLLRDNRLGCNKQGMSSQEIWYWACHFERTISGEHLRALCRVTFAKPWFREMLKGNQLLNHWALMTTHYVTSSNSSSTVGFTSCFPSSLPNSLGLSLQNTAPLTSVVKEWARHWKAFLLPLNLSARKTWVQSWTVISIADAYFNLTSLCSNVWKRWIHYFPAGGFAMIHSVICVHIR